MWIDDIIRQVEAKDVELISLPKVYRSNVVYRCTDCGAAAHKSVASLLKNGLYLCTACSRRRRTHTLLPESLRYNRLLDTMNEKDIISCDLAEDRVTYRCPVCNSKHTKNITNIIYKGTTLCLSA